MRAIAGHDGRYAITDDGRVWSFARPGRPTSGWLSVRQDKNGYRVVSLFDGERIRSYRIARLVLGAFTGPAPSDAHQANHINARRDDDRVENLEWTTPAQNSHHAIATGGRAGQSARLLTVGDVTLPISEWPRHPSITAEIVASRVFERGWPPQDALETPRMRRGIKRGGHKGPKYRDARGRYTGNARAATDAPVTGFGEFSNGR